MQGWASILGILSKGVGFSNFELSNKKCEMPVHYRYSHGHKNGKPKNYFFWLKNQTVQYKPLNILQWYLLLFFKLFLSFYFGDINECLGTLHTCSHHAFCNNTKGSYSCTCKHGLIGNGRKCKGKRWGRNIEESRLRKSQIGILVH